MEAADEREWRHHHSASKVQWWVHPKTQVVVLAVERISVDWIDATDVSVQRSQLRQNGMDTFRTCSVDQNLVFCLFKKL